MRDYYCPCCGAENPKLIVKWVTGEVIGCDDCLYIEDGQMWLLDTLEEAKDVSDRE